MSQITKWFLDNPVAANLLMVFILLSGYLSFKALRVESFPQIPPSEIVINVVYPGGTAAQVDQGITQRIEDAVSSIAGIKNIYSSSSAGYASVRVKKSSGININRLMEKIRNEVESIVGFPANAERPRIYIDEFGNLASFIMIHGDVNNELLQQVATKVQNSLKKQPEISKVSNLGKRRQELIIKPDQNKLKSFGLSIETLSDSILKWSLEYRSGSLNTASGHIVLRGDGYADNLKSLQQLPVVTNSLGNVLLQDVAKTERGYEDDDSIVRFKGQNAIALMVSTSAKDNLLEVSKAVEANLEKLKASLPVGVSATVMADMAPYIEEQLDLLGTNAWQGLIIVVVLLGLFLEIRLALWVALGIPISVAGAVSLMGVSYFDYSINDITLFGMILVLGILVDDAVVVGESIHSARKQYKDPKEAAFKGVESVAVATMFGVLTTIAAFSPMLWIENELAQVLAGFSAVVIFALIFSLIESKFILPTHLCIPHRKNGQRSKITLAIEAARNSCNKGLSWFSDHIYQPSLAFSLQNKIATLLLFIALVLASYGAILKGNIKSVFFPEIPGRYATLKVTMDQDSSLTLIKQNTNSLEQALIQTNKRLTSEYGFSQPAIEKFLVSMDGSNIIELTAELSKQALATIPSEKLLATWQEETGVIEGAYAVSFAQAEQPAGGTGIMVSAPSIDLARHVTKQLKQALMQQQGVNDVYDDTQSGTRQLKAVLNQRGIQLGIDKRTLASTIGGYFGEVEIHRLLDGGEELKVLVRLAKQEKRTLSQLKETPIQVADHQYVTLGEISDITFTREPDVLYRRNREQVISIFWRQERTIQSPEAVWGELQQSVVPRLLKQYPEVMIKATGEFEEITEVKAGFKKAMILTLLLVYILLAIPLKSYWQPLIIMSVIPFGFAGAIYGHGIMGLSFSLLSMFGLMAMTGVVVNDSLVLMTRFNQLYHQGLSVTEALIAAGKSRLRAIFLTTVTTVCGLLPLLSETSEQAQYLKPAAVSLVFGEIFATPITLILIPILLSLGKYKTKEPQVDNKASEEPSPFLVNKKERVNDC